MGELYKVVDLESNKIVYIGVTSKTTEQRWYWHCRNAPRNSIIDRKIRKYGKDRFEAIPLIISNDKNYLLEMERRAVISYNTKIPNGFNITDGGIGTLGRPHSQMTRNKLSMAAKKRAMTQEGINHLKSISALGIEASRNNDSYNKESRCKAISESRKRYWDKWRTDRGNREPLRDVIERHKNSLDPEIRAKREDAMKRAWIVRKAKKISAIAWTIGMFVSSMAAAQVRVPPLRTVATLGTCTNADPKIVAVYDGVTQTDCATGGGTYDVKCVCRDGTWIADPYMGTDANIIRSAAGVVKVTDGSSGTGDLVAGTITASLTGNASTASALAANGSNCSAGNYPLGVDASGAVESCTAAATGTIGGSTGSTDNALLRADGTGGATAQASVDSIDDTTGRFNFPASWSIGPATDYTNYFALVNAAPRLQLQTSAANYQTSIVSMGTQANAAASGVFIGGYTGFPAFNNSTYCFGWGEGTGAHRVYYGSTKFCMNGDNRVGLWSSPATFDVYGMSTDASNYVRASLAATSTDVTLAAETAGTGADDVPIKILPAGTAGVQMGTQVSTSTATPLALSLGGTYGDASLPLKLKLYDDGTAANEWGFGLSTAVLFTRIKNTNGNTFAWYWGSNRIMNWGDGASGTNSYLTIAGTGQATTGNTAYIADNNRGGNAATTVLGLGNSAATGTFWGYSKADFSYLYNYGASSTGLGVGTTTSDPLIFGTNDTERARFDASSNNLYLGNGATAASPSGATLNATGGSGTNIAGASLTLAGGKGTGTGTPGSVAIQVSDAGSTGTTLQTLKTKFLVQNHAISMPDNTATALYTVSLPTEDTGCATHISFTYVATDGTDTVAHSGIFICAFTNANGTVTGSCTDSGEAINGTGCGAGCDSESVTVASTTATMKAAFNNTLSVTGSLTYNVLNNSCLSLTPQ